MKFEILNKVSNLNNILNRSYIVHCDKLVYIMKKIKIACYFK